MAKQKKDRDESPLTVTNENFGELLLESAAEAVEIHEGRAAPARVHSYPVTTARDVEVEPAPVPSAEEIRAIREQLNVSQDVFAQILNVSTFTDRSWEQGQRAPDGAALRLLQIARRHPKVLTAFMKDVNTARRRAHGSGVQRGRNRAGR